MGTKEEYKARNREREARQAEKQKSPEKEPWWFKQKNPIDRFTGWLVAWTALLFIATIINACVLHSTDEKIKESYVAVQRPIVTAKEVIISPNVMPLYWMFGVRFENSGNTPTSGLEFITVSSQGFPKDPAEVFKRLPPTVSKFNALLGPKAQDILEGTGSGLPVKALEEMALSRSNYYISGIIHYRDGFKGTDPHITKYCFAIVPYIDNGQLKAGVQRCLYWNCADEECKKDRERFDAAFPAANVPRVN